MLLHIFIIVSSLVALNFLLLFLSCNKGIVSNKKLENKSFTAQKTTIQLAPNPLAPTGS